MKKPPGFLDGGKFAAKSGEKPTGHRMAGTSANRERILFLHHADSHGPPGQCADLRPPLFRHATDAPVVDSLTGDA
jgi:hypothetical protein